MKKLYSTLLFFYFAMFATVHAQWINASFNNSTEQANYSYIKFINSRIGVVSENHEPTKERFPEFTYITFNSGKKWERKAVYDGIDGGALIPLSANTWLSTILNI